MTDDTQIGIDGGGASWDRSIQLSRRYGKTFTLMDFSRLYPDLLRPFGTLHASRRATDQKRWWKRVLG